ncbi:hypothetical protein H8E88_04645 [candidate division KSB1 bacterium]|nr:hypothetical protein [candidate division KSB1 bacterium]
MKRLIVLISILAIFLVCVKTEKGERSITGKIIYKGKQTGPVVVKLYKLRETSEGTVNPLQKREIYGAKESFKTKELKKSGKYSFTDLPQGHFSVLAFIDTDENGELGFDPPEPLGWYSAEMGGKYDPINLTEPGEAKADCYLRCPTPFTKEDKFTEHGSLRWRKGLPVLQFWGTVEERGFAHGYLVGKQILDFFEFYIIEDSWRSPVRYQEIFVPFLENNLNCPDEFIAECEAVIKGMKASGTNMKLGSLGREFYLTDLLAINAYIERRAAYPVFAPSSCTQFAFWGERTKGGETNGGLIAARNMDGECDVRKVTVSHFLLFAVDPAESGRKRWVSAMWPGFVGTISGINENGLYSMENAGGTGSGPVVTGIVPCSWVQRLILETASNNATPESILKLMENFKSEGGGITTPGSIILWAVPYDNQQSPAFVFEGDRFGGVMRLPTDVRPTDPFNIMATNYHLKYGFDHEQPSYSFGRRVSFSSLWRYEAGKNLLEAWSRQGRQLGIDDAKRLLKTVAHGTTEYAVIFSANDKKIFVAVDDLKTDMWDAPFMDWIEFGFDELFEK